MKTIDNIIQAVKEIKQSKESAAFDDIIYHYS